MHTVSYYTAPYHDTPYHTIPNQTTSHCMTQHYTTWNYITSHHITHHYTTYNHITPHYTITPPSYYHIKSDNTAAIQSIHHYILDRVPHYLHQIELTKCILPDEPRYKINTQIIPLEYCWYTKILPPGVFQISVPPVQSTWIKYIWMNNRLLFN